MTRDHGVEETSLVSLATFVVWCELLAAGVIGAMTPYSHPLPVAKLPPIQAEVLNVELTDDPLPEPEMAAPMLPRVAQPEPPTAVSAPQQAPSMILVAKPVPMIEFALPVEGPVRVVEPKQASYSPPPAKVAPQPVNTATATGTGDKVNAVNSKPGKTTQPLTFGRGEGKQPAPRYPRRAVLEGQEGAVLIRFTIGENGRVIAAEAVRPSPWPLLNEEALRTVRERWRFRPGAVRSYEVSIRFVLED